MTTPNGATLPAEKWCALSFFSSYVQDWSEMISSAQSILSELQSSVIGLCKTITAPIRERAAVADSWIAKQLDSQLLPRIFEEWTAIEQLSTVAVLGEFVTRVHSSGMASLKEAVQFAKLQLTAASKKLDETVGSDPRVIAAVDHLKALQSQAGAAVNAVKIRAATTAGQVQEAFVRAVEPCRMGVQQLISNLHQRVEWMRSLRRSDVEEEFSRIREQFLEGTRKAVELTCTWYRRTEAAVLPLCKRVEEIIAPLYNGIVSTTLSACRRTKAVVMPLYKQLAAALYACIQYAAAVLQPIEQSTVERYQNSFVRSGVDRALVFADGKLQLKDRISSICAKEASISNDVMNYTPAVAAVPISFLLSSAFLALEMAGNAFPDVIVES